MNKPIIIFDGICNLCNAVVQFIIERDPKAVFSFIPMQSDKAKRILEQYQLTSSELDTIVLIKNGHSFTRSHAALEITKGLQGYWFLLNISKIIPSSLRDLIYFVIAHNRYRLLGKRATCMVPEEHIRKRFIN